MMLRDFAVVGLTVPTNNKQKNIKSKSLSIELPLFIYFVLLKVVKNRNRKGYRNADFKLNPEYSEFQLNYDIIKTKIIPILQSKVFCTRYVTIL